MADIDQLIAGAAKTNANFDFNSLINVPARQAAEEQNKQQLRDLFKTDLPRNPDKSINWGEVSARLAQQGEIGQAITTENTGIARDQLKLGAEALKQQQSYERGQPPQQPEIVSPPSANRQAPTPVAPSLNKGGVQAGSPQGDQPGSIVGLVSAAGIPDDKAGPVIINLAKAAGIDPNAAVPPGILPRIQGALQAFIGRTGGQSAPPQPGGQAVAQAPIQGQPQPGSSAPIQPTPVPTQAIQGQPPPVTAASTGTTAPDIPSRIDQGIAMYAGQMGNTALPEPTRKAAEARLKFLQSQKETTPEQKNFIQAKLEGFTGTMQDFAVQTETDKANAGELGKNFAKKYEGAIEGGVIAASTIPKVDMALSIVKNDPNFYGGIGEKYNLAIKQVAAALGLPDTSVGQQLVAKEVADQTVNAIRAFAASSPVGRVLQKEVEAITASLGSTKNTKEALGPLLQVQRNVLQTMGAVSDIAQNHNGGSGRLDPAYDRAVTSYLRTHPVIDGDLRAQIEKATGQNKVSPATTPAAANPYEAEMRRRGLLK